MYGGIIHEGAKKVKKSFVRALSTVCLFAAGAFFMGCANPSGGNDGSGNGSSNSGFGTGSGSGTGGKTPPVTYIGRKTPGTVLAVGDIVFNDGSATSYSVIDARTDKKCTDAEKAAAIAVIFRVGDGTEGNKTLGVGIKHERNGLAWCKDSSIKGYSTNFTETVCDPDVGTEAPSLTFKNSPNTDGSKNLGKMVLQMGDDDDTKLTVLKSGKLLLIDKKASTYYTNFKKNYPAFEFAYYYGLNYGHNITSGSDFENGWYLPSLSELNDIYQANKTGKVIENALGATGGNKFEGSSYWSSSQYASNVNYAYELCFYDGNRYNNVKVNNTISVCAVRAFN